MNIPSPRCAAAALFAASLFSFSIAARADDTDLTRKGTYTTSNGGSGSTESTVTRANGTADRQGTWTNAAGGTGNWQSRRTWNPATQTAAVNGSATRPNGAASTWRGTATRTAPGAFANKGTITLSNGKVITYSGTETRTAPGTWNRQAVITTANGKTIDRSVATSVSGGTGARTATTTLPDGKTVTTNASFTQSSTSVPAPASP